jgi:hypothetical protein
MLNRVLYTSALISIQRNPESRTFYDRKRTEGKHHTQAVLALARRRVNVMWALIRDRRCTERGIAVLCGEGGRELASEGGHHKTRQILSEGPSATRRLMTSPSRQRCCGGTPLPMRG